MRRPPLFQPAVTATLSPDPLKQLQSLGYAALGIETWPKANRLMTMLKRKPYNRSTTYLGLCAIGLIPTLVKQDDHYWVLCRACGSLELTLCELNAVQMLAEAGYHFNPGSIRLAYKMPHLWSPLDTMTNIDTDSMDTTFYGSLPAEACAVALPITFEQNPSSPPRWASWVAVDLESSGTLVTA